MENVTGLIEFLLANVYNISQKPSIQFFFIEIARESDNPF